MNSLETLIFLMSIGIIMVGLALRLRLPYPISLVIGGAVLSFLPGLSEIDFDPNSLLVIVLPPVLYYAAYNIPFKEFQQNIKDILWLAMGLVVVTTLVLGILFKWLFPDLPWALAFTFGALISPPDAVAATTVIRRFALSSKLITTLEGESLINDASGLVLYRMGVVALLSGTFSFADASWEFVKVVLGGSFVGLVTGYALHIFSSRFFNPILAVVYSFTIPYLTYVIADFLHVSGILAVVISGLIGSRMLITHFSSLTRVVGWASWDVLIIFLNCFIFSLIGLQLNGVIQRLTYEKTLLYLLYSFLLALAMVIIRFIWVYIRKGYVFYKTKDLEERKEILQDSVILGWSGMRGIVSLTLALALPFTLADGTPLPGRDIVIFLTFSIILQTLLIPGLTLETLINTLHINASLKQQETKLARMELLKAAKEEITRLYKAEKLDGQTQDFLLNYFKSRHQFLEVSYKTKHSPTHILELARLHVVNKKRERLIEMWKKNEITDQLFHILERELDLEESYLARAQI